MGREEEEAADRGREVLLIGEIKQQDTRMVYWKGSLLRRCAIYYWTLRTKKDVVFFLFTLSNIEIFV